MTVTKMHVCSQVDTINSLKNDQNLSNQKIEMILEKINDLREDIKEMKVSMDVFLKNSTNLFANKETAASKESVLELEKRVNGLYKGIVWVSATIGGIIIAAIFKVILKF